jgi:hypothetical protein
MAVVDIEQLGLKVAPFRNPCCNSYSTASGVVPRPCISETGANPDPAGRHGLTGNQAERRSRADCGMIGADSQPGSSLPRQRVARIAGVFACKSRSVGSRRTLPCYQPDSQEPSLLEISIALAKPSIERSPRVRRFGTSSMQVPRSVGYRRDSTNPVISLARPRISRSRRTVLSCQYRRRGRAWP